MEQLFKIFRGLIEKTDLSFKRYLYDQIDWNNRLIAIVGSRGVGKTTLMWQHIKENYDVYSGEVLYVSLDNFWFMSNSLWDLATWFNTNGGKVLYIDEVHKYPNWSREIKNIYDSYPDMKIVFTGSSMLDIFSSSGDISRRARKYTLYGMSMREYIEYEYGKQIKSYTIREILTNHVRIATEIKQEIKPIPVFKKYLEIGYFPFYKEDEDGYLKRLTETITAIIEVDLPANFEIEYSSIIKIKRLYSLISEMVPFTPNVSNLAAQIDATRQSLIKYLNALEQAKAVILLDKEAKGLKGMVKPEKIYLGNTNYAYAFARKEPEIGNIRETFFMSMMQVEYDIRYSAQTDFFVEQKYSFEIGGKNKGNYQIEGIEDAYVVKDDIEVGVGNIIPLWLFGFMY